MNDDTIFTQSPEHTVTDMKRSREVKVMPALTVSGGPAVFIHGKGLRLLLPAGEAARIAREITSRLSEAKTIAAQTHYRSYSLEPTDSTTPTTDDTATHDNNTTIKENN